jgi:ATP-dependent DNA helicase RecG
MNRDTKDLIEELNQSDENLRLEAKTGFGKSVLETISAFSNEPNLDGGVVLIGIKREEDSLFPTYKIVGVDNPDAMLADIASQCADSFNLSLRLRIKTETLEGKLIVRIDVPELSDSNKPVYLKKRGLPHGAFRRIGSTDQHCTEDDLVALYNGRESVYDNRVLEGADLTDIDLDALNYYRTLRKKVNPEAEELKWEDEDLLKSLSAVVKNKKGEIQPSIAGILLFGKKQSLRRLLPGYRLDYIRIPGKEWVENPDERFSTVDMRDSLLMLVQRAQSQIFEDLPKAFSLEEGQLQAKGNTLPARVLREAIVNSVMHASYRIQQPIQIRRYNNRIEICNPGYSLKSEDQLGEPGSRLRNPHLAAVFHETNLAETKGSGIRTMRKLMEKTGFEPPTFESDRANDHFTIRLLLHHFLTEEDISWLNSIGALELSDTQKKALIFVRELGAINNQAYRQLNGLDTLSSSTELRKLRKLKYLIQKGKSNATYYVFGERGLLISDSASPTAKTHELPVETHELSAKTHELSAKTHELSAKTHKSLAQHHILERLPEKLQLKLIELGTHPGKDKRKEIILEICECGEWSSSEIASLVKIKDPLYLRREYLNKLLKLGKLTYKYPEMPNHPRQAYKIKHTRS